MPPGPGIGFVHSSRKPTARQSARRCTHSLELGCNPVVPFSDFHEALAGPADGTRTTALQKTSPRYGLVRRCFFAPTHPPLLKTINEKD